MSLLLLVSADLRKIRRSATFKVPKGDYRLELSELGLFVTLVSGNGDKIAVKHGDLIPIPETSNYHLELPEIDKKLTAILGDLE